MEKQRFSGIATVNTHLFVSSVLHAVKQLELVFFAYLQKPALKLFTIYDY